MKIILPNSHYPFEAPHPTGIVAIGGQDGYVGVALRCLEGCGRNNYEFKDPHDIAALQVGLGHFGHHAFGPLYLVAVTEARNANRIIQAQM